MEGVPHNIGGGRPLAMRMRPDLTAERQVYEGRRYWLVKDPLALQYFRFEEEEYALLTMLDGRCSLEDLKARFEEQFRPQRIELAELHRLVIQLFQSGLVVSDAAGQGDRLIRKRNERQAAERWGAATNILAIRFPGFDPDRLLTWLNGWVGWFFSWPAFVCCLLLAVSALTLVTVEFDAFRTKLPTLQQFFAPRNWLWLAVALAFTKVLHEMGHGLACKRFGGECHEMGVMLLVFTPCLYCNVSDSWMLPSKWRRAAIGAAGMYVELVLASIATFLWWFSREGAFNYFCLNVMFVCSVSTLLFNLNPLLRYDGYYILSDLTEIPNLRQKATAVLQRKLASWLTDGPQPHDPFLPQRGHYWFAFYSVAAAVYRWVVTFSILWLLYQLFEPYGVKVLGQLLACAAVVMLLGAPLWQAIQYFRVPGRWEAVNKLRLALTLAVLLAVGGLLFVPLPHHVVCELQIEPQHSESVFVDLEGKLTSIQAEPWRKVEKGQVLATLDNIEARRGLIEMISESRQLAAKIEGLQRQIYHDDRAASEIEQITAAKQALDARIEERSQDLRSLTLRAPTAGVIIPPPPRSEDPEADPTRQLANWSGTPLQKHNQGAVLEEGRIFCSVGDPARLQAVLAVDEGDRDFVLVGQHVEVMIDGLPGEKFAAKLNQLPAEEWETLPVALTTRGGGALQTTTDRKGREKPLGAVYRATAPLTVNPDLVALQATGWAKIDVGHRSVAYRLWRAALKTFNFDL